MGTIFSDLYIEVYTWLVGVVGDKYALKVAAVLVTILQLFNIYSIILLADRILKINVLGFLATMPWIIALICIGIIVFNVLTYRLAAKILTTDGPERYIRRWFVLYIILTILIFAAHFMFKPGINAAI